MKREITRLLFPKILVSSFHRWSLFRRMHRESGPQQPCCSPVHITPGARLAAHRRHQTHTHRRKTPNHDRLTGAECTTDSIPSFCSVSARSSTSRYLTVPRRIRCGCCSSRCVTGEHLELTAQSSQLSHFRFYFVKTSLCGICRRLQMFRSSEDHWRSDGCSAAGAEAGRILLLPRRLSPSRDGFGVRGVRALQHSLRQHA